MHSGCSIATWIVRFCTRINIILNEWVSVQCRCEENGIREKCVCVCVLCFWFIARPYMLSSLRNSQSETQVILMIFRQFAVTPIFNMLKKCNKKMEEKKIIKIVTKPFMTPKNTVWFAFDAFSLSQISGQLERISQKLTEKRLASWKSLCISRKNMPIWNLSWVNYGEDPLINQTHDSESRITKWCRIPSVMVS